MKSGRPPRIAALILAAGRSRRMGEENKLLAEIGGKSMIRRVAEAALESNSFEVVVVTGHEADLVEDAIRMLDVEAIHNPDFDRGMSTSLAVGVSAISGRDRVDGLIVLLGDMPAVTGDHLDRLIAAFDPDEDRAICLPRVAGKRRNPVLFARRFFEEMAKVEGDVGAKHLIGANEAVVCDVVFDKTEAFEDIDTPLALESHVESRRSPIRDQLSK